MPHEKFLMGKNRQKIESDEEQFVDDDFNDEWIVVDKNGVFHDLDKYNSAANLTKENTIKDETKSSCILIGRDKFS